ncbi:MAG: hypothetical protein AVDCRST_MAG73-871 [uncultured Thermomicrobiales bacterium]|uniref:Putative restriction endonuclease domain-containing protein n=1 Tax=uncultured Thermomicrobiales bacterium TaxID=1645740 RepID=A0A6J4TQX1_9BACT|nr:MAG: hypothetical protein AVDCRST_MAG73-871 [uncultured Thermomicrobiales bacterium]
MSVTTRLYTVEALMEMPGDEPWELWEGELQQVGGAGGEASGIAGEIFVALHPFVRRGTLGLLTGADGAYILARDPDTVVVPDVGFVRWDRLPGGIRPKGPIPVPPDLAVEVRSPTDRPGRINAKLIRYRRAGVPLVWAVEPDRRLVLVYVRGELVAELGDGGVLDGGDVLPGFALTVTEIFA